MAVAGKGGEDVEDDSLTPTCPHQVAITFGWALLGAWIVNGPIFYFMGLEFMLEVCYTSVALSAASIYLLKSGYHAAGKLLLSLVVPLAIYYSALIVERSIDVMEYSAFLVVPAVIFRTDEEHHLFYVAFILILLLRVVHATTVGMRADLVPQHIAVKVNIIIGFTTMLLVGLVLGTYRKTLKLEEERRNILTRARSFALAKTSHEIRTPLNSMLSLFDIILMSDLTPKMRHAFSLLASCGNDLIRIVNDTLDLSKLEANAVVFESEPTSITDCVESTVTLFSALASFKKNTLRVSCPKDLNVFADSVRLRQILRNLVGNALKFCSEGEVTVRVTTESILPYCNKQEADILVKFMVHDTGIGIPSNQLKSVFDVYRQADNTSGAWTEGSGLGLPICKHLVEGMGGQIHAESLPNGTGLFFEIPFRISDAPMPVTMKPPPVPSGVDLCLLIVDDNMTNRVVLRALLRKLGFKDIVLAASGQEAVDAVRMNKSINVVLLDLHMPGMDGLTTARQLRTEKTSLPVIYAASASVEEGERAMCEEVMDGFLPKPISKVVLIETMAVISQLVATRSGCPSGDQLEKSVEDLLQPPCPSVPPLHLDAGLTSPVLLQSPGELAAAFAEEW